MESLQLYPAEPQVCHVLPYGAVLFCLIPMGVDYVPIEVHVFYYSSVQLVIFLQNRKQLITQRCRSLLIIYSRVIKETKRFYFREK